MKKIIFGIVVIEMLFLSVTFAKISESFSKTLELINVPEKNVDGYEINEEMYKIYNLVVYGNPQDVVKNQRWKDNLNGKYVNKETNKRGEYRILGYALNGSVVNNELFPDDYISGKSPEEWNYIVIDDAYASWNDTSKYQTLEQYDYMLNQKLSRNGVTYNLTAKDIGLTKARLEAFATWKTAGSIFTLKKDDRGIYWGATFSVPPMAADAEVEALLNFPNGLNYSISKETNILEIPFDFGAKVNNLSGFAKETDIKNLSAELEVQYNIYDEISTEKEREIIKSNKIVIDKNKYKGINNIEIIVKNTAILETQFKSEAPMIDIKEIVLNINLQDEETYITVKDVNKRISGDIPRPKISSIKLYRKSINGLDEKQELFVAKKTNTEFICAGQVLIIEATILNSPDNVLFYIEGDSKIQTYDELTKKFLYEEPKNRGEKLIFGSLTKQKNSYKLPRNMEEKNGKYILEYVIPYNTKQTIHSWNTLRNENKNGFEIKKDKLLTRISSPYKLKIRASNAGGTVTKSYNLDVFERWDTVYNRNIKEYVK